MDPNQALENIRTARVNLDSVDGDTLTPDVELLLESVNALDVWLSKGGFLPDEWRRPVVPAYGVNTLVDKMLWDVFVCALEGGIGYWAASASYHIWADDDCKVGDVEGFHSDVVDAEAIDPNDGEFPPGRIDRSVLVKGFELVHAGPVKGMHEQTRSKFLTMLTARLAGMDDDRVDIDFDAGDADSLVQAGFLGSVVFG